MKPKDHLDGIVKLMNASMKETSSRFLQEAARMYQLHGPDKARVLLEALWASRKAKRDAEFDAYTTKPCGCYRDPGGHP